MGNFGAVRSIDGWKCLTCKETFGWVFEAHRHNEQMHKGTAKFTEA